MRYAVVIEKAEGNYSAAEDRAEQVERLYTPLGQLAAMRI
jgi:hypothetical protein